MVVAAAAATTRAITVDFKLNLRIDRFLWLGSSLSSPIFLGRAAKEKGSCVPLFFAIRRAESCGAARRDQRSALSRPRFAYVRCDNAAKPNQSVRKR
jgi:hypothetical protein